ncbi:MAG: short chain dehydrogenase [Neisseriaceae bacterium]|nr:short chain dehydrogenase [Neisseriaceae bacterium]
MNGQRKRILLIGASGIIGKAVDAALAAKHDIIRAGLRSGDVRFDLADPEAMMAALAPLGPLDAIISTAGQAHFVGLQDVVVAPLAASKYGLGLMDKLMGQVNLALAARDCLRDGGSITLTSGTTSDEPIIGGSSLSMVNGALEKWAMAAATEMPRGIRVNVVSPSLAEEVSDAAAQAFPGFVKVPAATMALAYVRCVESLITGQTLKV